MHNEVSVSMRCDEFKNLLEPYLDERLDERDRKSWRSHLETCRQCREWALSVEPTLLFCTPKYSEPNPAQIAACSSAVSAMIRQDRLQRRLQRRLRPRVSMSWLAAAAAVVLMIGGGMMWWLTPIGGALEPADGASVWEPGNLPAPKVEVDMEGEGVRIYHLADETDQDTAVVFVVNPAMES